MPRSIDLGDTAPEISHDPTNQMSSDPGLNKQINGLGNNLLLIPKLIIQSILGALGGLMNPFTAIETALGFLNGWASAIKSLLSGVAPTIQNGLESWFNGGGPFGGVAGFFAILRGVPDKLTEHTNAIRNLRSVAASMNTTVAYVGDQQDMVTVPRSQLVTIGDDGAKGQNVLDTVQTKQTGNNSNGVWISINCMPYVRPPATVGSSVGTIFYTPIVVDRNGIPGKIRFIGGTDNSIFSMNYYELALCAYIPDTGAIEKVWGSGNIKDTYADTNSLAEVEIPMGLDTVAEPQIVRPGQILFVAHQQVAPGIGQQCRAFGAVPQANVGRPSTMILKAACFRANGYSQGIPSTINLAALTPENRFIPWSAITVSAIPDEDENEEAP